MTPWFRKVTEAFDLFMLPALSSDAVNSMPNVHTYREGHDLGDVTVLPRACMPSYSKNVNKEART